MRLMRRIPASDGGAGACRRWERELILSISDDLHDREAGAFRRHLEECEGCRAEAERMRRLRAACADAGRQRASRSIPGLWEGIQAGLEAKAPRPALEPVKYGGPVQVRRLAIAAAVLAASLLAISWVFFPVLIDNRPRTDPVAAIKDRLSTEWDEFVSGSGPRAEGGYDPFPAEIPNPDVIEF